MAAVQLGDMRVSIEVVERKLLPPAAGTRGEPKHRFSRVFLAQAAVKTRSGSSEFGQIEIKGERVTHTFTIRYVSIPFDVRNWLRDARGQLYKILAVENVDLANDMIRIHAANSGAETVEGAR